MPRKKSTKTENVKQKNVEKQVKPKKETNVEEEVKAVSVETATEVNDVTPKKKREVPTKDSVMEEFDSTIDFIEKEIENLRNSSAKTKGVKFLRSLRKRFNTLRAHTARVLKKRKPSNRKNNGNSGFLKPVSISSELSKFTGWDPAEKQSRVDVTKYICNYIKEKDLQNPDDRRQIRVNDDPKLKKLLGYDSSKDEKPLTYYSLQTYMKKHFVKDKQ